MGDGTLIRVIGSVPTVGVASAAGLPNYREAKAQALATFEHDFLLRALRASDGNVSAAALLVGKERRAFGKLLKKYAIDRLCIDG
jgi:transcriptional regulator of acetoin/glycerol metabolism